MTDKEAELIKKLILDEIVKPLMDRMTQLEAEVAELRWLSNLPNRNEVLARIRPKAVPAAAPTSVEEKDRSNPLYGSTSLG